MKLDCRVAKKWPRHKKILDFIPCTFPLYESGKTVKKKDKNFLYEIHAKKSSTSVCKKQKSIWTIFVMTTWPMLNMNSLKFRSLNELIMNIWFYWRLNMEMINLLHTPVHIVRIDSNVPFDFKSYLFDLTIWIHWPLTHESMNAKDENQQARIDRNICTCILPIFRIQLAWSRFPSN